MLLCRGLPCKVLRAGGGGRRDRPPARGRRWTFAPGGGWKSARSQPNGRAPRTPFLQGLCCSQQAAPAHSPWIRNIWWHRGSRCPECPVFVSVMNDFPWRSLEQFCHFDVPSPLTRQDWRSPPTSLACINMGLIYGDVIKVWWKSLLLFSKPFTYLVWKMHKEFLTFANTLTSYLRGNTVAVARRVRSLVQVLALSWACSPTW